MATASPPAQQRPPPWRDVRVLRVAAQAVFLLLVVGLLYYLWFNLITNLNRAGISTTFDFLQRPAGIRIPGSDFRPSQSNLAAIRVAITNTALVSFVGIGLATVLGVTIGILRLSHNWLAARFASLYVEALRNVPVLIIIIFWFVAVVLKLPEIAGSIEWGRAVTLSNRGLWIPWFAGRAGAGAYWVVVSAALAAAVAVGWWRTRHHERTGEPHHRVVFGLAAFVAAAVAGYFVLGQPFGVSLPERSGRQVFGGFRLTPEYAALTIALVLYTASHIAEIVRGAILSVPRGQTEAAEAVGLTRFQRMRYVVLPQAFRVAVPPTANQYLNLTKNSSLGVAIGMPEVTQVIRQIIGNGHPAPQSIAVMMGIYLSFSLAISLVTNLINRRLQLRER